MSSSLKPTASPVDPRLIRIVPTRSSVTPIMVRMGDKWEGEDSDGDLWEASWVSVTYLSKDLRDEARKLEGELLGARGAQAPSRRAMRRDEVRQRQERERERMQWSSRLRDRARGALA